MLKNVFLTSTLIAILASQVQSVTFYVSISGSDTWSGTLAEPNRERTDGPLATLHGAREAIRRLKETGKLKEPVTVLIRRGVYKLADTFVLNPRDSGTQECHITYSAYPGEKPVISGGRHITGWRKYSKDLWVAEVPQAKMGQWIFRQLFVNGQRRTLARAPNTGFFRIVNRAAPLRDSKTGKEKDSSKLAFRFRRGDIKPWNNLNEINAVILRNWESAMLRLASVDTATNTVTFTGPMKWPFRPRQRYYIENVFDALDTLGEWYLDRKKGLLYYRPMPGEDMTRAEVVAPVLTQLVRLVGEPKLGLFVEHVRFEGLSFQHADYKLEPRGHGDWQAAVTVPAAIQARGARFCTFERCEVAHVGTYGIWFERGCTHNQIVQCEIHDLGAGGVRIGEPGIPQTNAAQTNRNAVSNNFIHDIGHLYYGAVGVWIGQSSDNVISHNEICDTYYTAISVGWSWGYHPTACHRNAIEYNHIHHIGRGMLYDMGAIYTLGISTGTKIRYNHIHHVWDWEEGYGAGGIYPDEGSTGLLIENNVVYLTTAGGLTVHYGRDNVVRNNIFALSRDAQIHLGRKDRNSSLTFEHNIVYFKDGDLFRRMSELKADYNVYWREGGGRLQFPGEQSFEEWQAKGYDKHSVVANPLFVNADRFDFRLRSDSPALKLGFKPIDLSKVGLYGPAEWVERPKQIKRPPTIIPPKFVPPPQLVDDGFEYTPIGAAADFAMTFGETKGASIRVTDELAASGRKCLKFVDAPGLKYRWNPHLFYMPHIRDGTVRLRFDLRFEPGAEIWHEWRDNHQPYRVGPSLGIDTQGRLSVAQNPLMQLPANQWIHFEIVCGMGKQASGTYDLAVTIPGHGAKRFEKLRCDPKCKRLDWLGFVSNAKQRAVFYLDDVKLQLISR